MNLAGLVQRSASDGPSRVAALAIVGTAKNVGKTVTMNYLAHELSERGFRIGLVSSGRDGEAVDSFTGEPKPSVVPPEGSWVATAEGVLGESGSLMEIADVSERPGLLGRLVLGRVREPAPIELVGPGSVRELGDVVGRLRSLGADLVLVDGALDRVAAANPEVTDAVILATGAEAGPGLAAVAERIEYITWLWSRPSPEDPLVRKLAREAVERGRVAFIERLPAALVPGSGYALRETPYRTCLGFEEEILARAGRARYAVVPGAVSQKFVSGAASWPENRDFGVIASSPVNVFMREDAGVPVFVLNEIRLLAITVNPVSHRGISYSSEEIVGAVAAAAERGSGARIPVFDVVSGVCDIRGVSDMAMG